MKKIIYTNLDGSVSIVIPAPKEHLEKIFGPLSDEAYELHVWERSVPIGSINPRYIEDSDIPKSREFRNAWVDVTKSSNIDIDLSKAKDIQLEKLRIERAPLLEQLDKEMLYALEDGDVVKQSQIKLKKQGLRDITEPLKALDITGINDIEVLNNIKELGKING